MLYIFNRNKLTYKKVDFVILVFIIFSILIVGFIFSYLVSKRDRIVYVKQIIYKTIKDTENVISANVTATMYYPISSQCDKDPLITACMYKIIPHKASEQKFVALSRDLLKRWGGSFTFGDRIKLCNAGKKSGIYIVADTMNKRFKRKIDILETKGTPLYKLNNVKIIKL
jgi:hypothetical protein